MAGKLAQAITVGMTRYAPEAVYARDEIELGASLRRAGADYVISTFTDFGHILNRIVEVSTQSRSTTGC